LSCSGGGSSFTGEEALSGTGKDAGAGEMVWLVSGASGCAGDAGFATFGLALELEACSGARGALKERKRRVSNQKKKHVGSNAKGRNLPRSDGSLSFWLGHADFLPFGLLRWIGLGLHSSLPADTSAGGRRSLVQRSGIDNDIIRDN
jgi:hypothetical protein